MALEHVDWPPDDPRWFTMLEQPLRTWTHGAVGESWDKSTYLTVVNRAVESVTIRSAPGYGNGLRSTALTTLNTAVLAPIPSAMTAMASSAKPRLRRSARPAYRRSPKKSLTSLALRRSRHSSLLLSIAPIARSAANRASSGARPAFSPSSI